MQYFLLARDEGIEPPPAVLETAVLPLYESRLRSAEAELRRASPQKPPDGK